MIYRPDECTDVNFARHRRACVYNYSSLISSSGYDNVTGSTFEFVTVIEIIIKMYSECVALLNVFRFENTPIAVVYACTVEI